jgi:hypothetical protein
MVKVIELPEGLQEVCPREIWVPESTPQTIVENKEPQPTEDKQCGPEFQRKLDLGTPL